MNPLNKHIVFLSFYLKAVLSTIHHYQRCRRPRRTRRDGTSDCRGASRSQVRFLFTLLSTCRDWFQTNCDTATGARRNRGFFCFRDRHHSPTFHDDDMSESLDRVATAVDELLTSTSESDDNVDWKAEDQEMLQEINRMIREIQSREVGNSSDQR